MLKSIKSEDDEGEVSVCDRFIIAGSKYIATVLPIHLAVINCYHKAKSFGGDSKRCPTKIVDVLIRKGAKTLRSSAFWLCNIEGYDYHNIAESTPTEIALFLKQFPETYAEEEQAKSLDAVIEMIAKVEAKEGGKNRPSSVLMLKAVSDTYKKMLFSEKFSDIQFVCRNEKGKVDVIPAHRIVLSAASPYFDTAFAGPWAENEDGKWNTSHSSIIMRSVLAHIYKGSIDEALIEKKYMSFLAVASEYELSSLKTLAVACCVRALSMDNIKGILQAAHLYQNKRLKKACFAFVKRNAVEALTDPKIMALATEDPPLWCELTKAIKGDKENGKSNKRPRNN